MAGSSDIRAGKAFVELYLQKAAFTQGLKTIGKEISAFGAGITAIGKRFALLGAAITAPMLAATHSWAESSREMGLLSQRTHMSVESLSLFKFAAEETGVGVEAMEGALHKSNKMLAAAAQGSGEANVALARMGLSVEQLMALKPEDRFMAMADGLAKIKDPAIRDGLMMQVMGKSASQLGPMLSEGSAGLKKFREEAEELGLIKSEASVKAGWAMYEAWDKLKDVAGTLKGVIGQALAPMLTGFAEALRQNVKAAISWVKEHRPMVTYLFQIGAAATVVGTSLLIVGKTVSIVGSAFRSMTSVLGIFGHGLDLLLLPLRKGLSLAFSALATTMGAVKSVIGGLISGVGTLASVAFKGLKIAVSGVFGGLKILADLAVGTVKGAFSVLGGAIDVAKFGFSLFSKTISTVYTIFDGLVNAIFRLAVPLVGVATGLAEVIAGISGTLAMLGPLLIPLALAAVAFGGLYQATKAVTGGAKAAADGIGKAKDAVVELGSAAVASGQKMGKELVASASAMGAATLAGSKSWGSTLQDFFTSLLPVVKRVTLRLRDDVVAGFTNLKDDVTSVWGTLQDALQAGDMASAWKVGLALMKLEWARFHGYLMQVWEDLKPTWNTTLDWLVTTWNKSIAGAGKLAGDLFADLKIGWGDLWDSVLSGLKTVLKTLDKAVDSMFAVINQVTTFASHLPGAAKSDRWQKAHDKALADTEAKENESKYGWSPLRDNYKKRMKKLGADKFLTAEEYASSRGDAAEESAPVLQSNMQALIPNVRTAEEKAKDDAAARASGDAFSARASGLAITGVGPVAADPQAQARSAAAVAAAQEELANAKSDAAAAAKERADKKAKADKEAKDKAGIGGDGAGLGGNQKITGTFSGAAAGMMAGDSTGKQIIEHMKRFIVVGEQTSTHTKELVDNSKVKA